MMASGYRHGGRTESFTLDGLNPRPVKTPAPAIDTKTNNKNLRCIMCEEIQQGPSKCDACPNLCQKVLRNPGAGDDWLQCEGYWAVRQGSCIHCMHIREALRESALAAQQVDIPRGRDQLPALTEYLRQMTPETQAFLLLALLFLVK